MSSIETEMADVKDVVVMTIDVQLRSRMEEWLAGGGAAAGVEALMQE